MRKILKGSLLSIMLLLGTAGTHAADIAVSMKDSQFQPNKIAAKRGDVLVVTNNDSMDHDAFVPTNGFGINAGNIKPGESKRFPLGKRGHFDLECVYHDQMKAKVTVK
jgi:plastocyanin